MLGLILATDSNFGMALNGKIPWKNTQDLKWFKHVTTGKNLIMGTNTLKSLPKQSLPNRTINILSKNTNFKQHTISSKSDFISLIQKTPELWITGGPQCINTIYQKWGFLPDIIFWTIVNDDYECDIIFPEINALTNSKNKIQQNYYEMNSNDTIFKCQMKTPLNQRLQHKVDKIIESFFQSSKQTSM